MWLYFTVQWVSLQYVIVAFLVHTHLLFGRVHHWFKICSATTADAQYDADGTRTENSTCTPSRTNFDLMVNVKMATLSAKFVLKNA